ncbi:Eukaryotic translation initiation factor 4B [Armadillidium vulgare]|nr:Eukaryotic translation initiation factor 4B [Armadillidium vulgare]
MSNAKKGKKTKGKPVSLGEFLGTSSTSGGSSVVVPTKSSWAEESEDFDDDRFVSTERIVLPTAPRQARGPSIDPDRIPNKPPYYAHVANLPFEVEDEDIGNFFRDLSVKSVRLPREGGEFGRFKGFAYVEFTTRNDLLESLSFNDEMCMVANKRDIAEE